MGITNNSDPVTCTSITYTKNKVAFLKSQTKQWLWHKDKNV